MRPRISIRGCFRPLVGCLVGWLVRKAFVENPDYGRRSSEKTRKTVQMLQTCQRSTELSQYVPKCPKMSNSDASLSERTCFLRPFRRLMVMLYRWHRAWTDTLGVAYLVRRPGFYITAAWMISLFPTLQMPADSQLPPSIESNQVKS